MGTCDLCGRRYDRGGLTYDSMTWKGTVFLCNKCAIELGAMELVKKLETGIKAERAQSGIEEGSPLHDFASSVLKLKQTEEQNKVN